jgi:hypothetical protein
MEEGTQKKSVTMHEAFEYRLQERAFLNCEDPFVEKGITPGRIRSSNERDSPRFPLASPQFVLESVRIVPESLRIILEPLSIALVSPEIIPDRFAFILESPPIALDPSPFVLDLPQFEDESL